MLQAPRSSDSKSFLRELQTALALIENEKDRNYFLEKFQEVFDKRKDKNTLFTGEKALKAELLVYLKQFDVIRTANVWPRNIPMDRKAIDEFLIVLQQRLLNKNIQGILELHLQDREINSPHIQFVGIKAQEAEIIIAQTLVDFKYELNMESALGKKDFTPYYEYNTKAKTQSLEDALDYEEKRKEIQEEDKSLEEMDIRIQELKDLLEKIKSYKKTFTTRLETNIQNYKERLNQKRKNLRNIRRRIRLRR